MDPIPAASCSPPGRDGETVQSFAHDLKAHGGYPEAIGNVTCDMSAAFIAGVQDYLPNADVLAELKDDGTVPQPLRHRALRIWFAAKSR